MNDEARCRNCVNLDHYGDCYKIFEGLRTECQGDAVRVKPDFGCAFFEAKKEEKQMSLYVCNKREVCGAAKVEKVEKAAKVGKLSAFLGLQQGASTTNRKRDGYTVSACFW